MTMMSPTSSRPDLYRLNAVAEPRGLNHHDRVGKRCDIGAVLTRADSFDEDQRVANSIE